MAKHNMKTDHFSSKKAAEYYTKGRPYVHDDVIQRMSVFFNLKKTVEWALDIGCGTGLSAIALKEIAHNVVALDISYDMIAIAPREQDMYYVNAVAEYIPIAATSFELVTISSAFHWFNEKQSANELNRVLKSSGRLVIYHNHLTPYQETYPEFEQWYYDIFKKRYPKPPRDYTIDLEYFKELSIIFSGEESCEKDIYFTAEQLMYHLLSLTHVISAVESGREKYANVTNWLKTEITQFPVFRSGKDTADKVKFHFDGTIKYFQKQK
ncbi:MAG: class I SAM-dependent methyltransferase [bacterium]